MCFRMFIAHRFCLGLFIPCYCGGFDDVIWFCDPRSFLENSILNTWIVTEDAQWPAIQDFWSTEWKICWILRRIIWQQFENLGLFKNREFANGSKGFALNRISTASELRAWIVMDVLNQNWAIINISAISQLSLLVVNVSLLNQIPLSASHFILYFIKSYATICYAKLSTLQWPG